MIRFDQNGVGRSPDGIIAVKRARVEELGVMSIRKVGTKIGCAAAKLAGVLFVIFLIAQVAPGGPFERLFATTDESGVAYGAPPSGPKR